MRDDDDADPDKGLVINRDEIRIGSFQDDVVADPDIPSDMDTAGTVQKHPKTLTPRQQKREQLQESIQQSPYRILMHGSLCIHQSTPLLLLELTQLAERITC
jgi:hypothetical protein